MKETSLEKCLSYADIKELPEKWDGKDSFAYGIAKCIRFFGNEDYVIARHDKKDGLVYVSKDFGGSSIRKILEVYPYSNIAKTAKEELEEKKQEYDNKVIENIQNINIDSIMKARSFLNSLPNFDKRKINFKNNTEIIDVAINEQKKLRNENND